MKPAIPYLTFSGNCAEAMHTYASLFDAEVTILTTLADAPIDTPPDAAELIFNAEIRTGDFVLKASDNPAGTAADSSISLFVEFDDPTDRGRVFDALADGGQVIFEPDGPFAMVRDRFDVQWMLTLPH